MGSSQWPAGQYLSQDPADLLLEPCPSAANVLSLTPPDGPFTKDAPTNQAPGGASISATAPTTSLPVPRLLPGPQSMQTPSDPVSAVPALFQVGARLPFFLGQWSPLGHMQLPSAWSGGVQLDFSTPPPNKPVWVISHRLYISWKLRMRSYVW